MDASNAFEEEMEPLEKALTEVGDSCINLVKVGIAEAIPEFLNWVKEKHGVILTGEDQFSLSELVAEYISEGFEE